MLVLRHGMFFKRAQCFPHFLPFSTEKRTAMPVHALSFLLFWLPCFENRGFSVHCAFRRKILLSAALPFVHAEHHGAHAAKRQRQTVQRPSPAKGFEQRRQRKAGRRRAPKDRFHVFWFVCVGSRSLFPTLFAVHFVLSLQTIFQTVPTAFQKSSRKGREPFEASLPAPFRFPIIPAGLPRRQRRSCRTDAAPTWFARSARP